MIKTRVFSANTGDKSLGNNGADGIKKDIDNLLDNDSEIVTYIGDFTTLTTEATNLVEAINEHETQINDIVLDVGNVSTLNTASKEVVGAINEVNTNKVDKVTGKQLSTNDYNNTDKGKVDLIGTEPLESVAQTIIGAINETRGTAGGGIALSTYYDNGDSGLQASNVKDAIDEINANMIGMIVMWSGATNNIPTKWALCDGNNGTPDLRGRFIVGAGGDYAVGNTGGEATHTLTTDEMPSHNHSGSANSSGSHSHYSGIRINKDDNNSSYQSAYAKFGTGDNVEGQGFGSNEYVVPAPAQTGYPRYYGITSTDGSHSHSLSINDNGSGNAHENRPPYYALCYIMKIS